MKKFSIVCIIAIFLYSCREGKLYLEIKPDYEGWIYIVKSNDDKIRDTLYPDSNGIIYMSHKQFESIKVQIISNGIVLKDTPFKIYQNEYSSGNYDNKIQYCKFYYPLTTELKNDKLYDWNGRRLNEFQYYYYSGILDKFKLFRFDE
ncbi:hypothetical protein [Polluticaenibacter yanchengensis]|uniref:Lipoprotein n=1 Tax=Polluticaenibacter yanchengensis TaxID=3014562 RepID=A0ABT4UQ06_9BACT|nr:hypothetical protein [Chitinophagaceae bacterium LY-5]